MNEKLLEYLSNSFLKDYLSDDNITDISYNGKYFFALDNRYGRKKLDLDISQEEVTSFIRQIANLSEKSFSYSEPILDVFCSRFRINAVHSVITKYLDEKVVSFSIRIASITIRILTDDTFFDETSKNIILKMLKNHESIIIGGLTGVGKTEFQKYLLLNLEENCRVIVIDNIQELDNIHNLANIDLTCWSISSSFENRSFATLIKNALRSNPDYLIIAESRDKEMKDVMVSLSSGHPLITTIHVDDVRKMRNRLARMVMQYSQNQDYKDILEEINYSIKNYILLKREILPNKEVKRFVSQIAIYNEKTQNLDVVYERKNYEKI